MRILLRRSWLVGIVSVVLCAVDLLAAPASAAPRATTLNDWNCRPSASTGFPEPVILIHGFTGSASDWRALVPQLTKRGACVFAISYGGVRVGGDTINGLAPLAQSEAELAAFIIKVRTRTESEKVQIVGHSEGGLLTVALAQRLGAQQVSRVVLLAPATHGTTMRGLTTQLEGVRPQTNQVLGAVGCGACRDLLVDSQYVKQHNKAPIAVPGIDYHVLAISNDDVVTPGGPASFIDEPGVENLLANTKWPKRSFEHGSLPRDTAVVGWVVERLQR